MLGMFKYHKRAHFKNKPLTINVQKKLSLKKINIYINFADKSSWEMIF